MSNKIKIEKMSDIAALTPEQFERFLPDLKTWHEYVRKPEFQAIIDVLPATAMIWFDDGKNDMLGINVNVISE